MNIAQFFLPWPDKRLSPNATGHWSSLHKAKRKAKNDAYWSVKEAGIGVIEADHITVRYSFFPPSHRAYDMDNLIASMKSAQDGIALAIGIDDSKFHLEISPRGPVERNGMVKVELFWSET